MRGDPFIIPVLDKVLEQNEDEKLEKLLLATFSHKHTILETFLVVCSLILTYCGSRTSQ